MRTVRSTVRRPLLCCSAQEPYAFDAPDTCEHDLMRTFVHCSRPNLRARPDNIARQLYGS